jgi:hypothetical protein
MRTALNRGRVNNVLIRFVKAVSGNYGVVLATENLVLSVEGLY